MENKIVVIHHNFYEEDRGIIGSYYNKQNLVGFCPEINFVQDRYSKSYKGGVRGFHTDGHTWKYISCLLGKIKIVTWDIKTRQRNYFILDNKTSILIPPLTFNAHQALDDIVIFHYKQSEYYESYPADKQYSVYYDDSTICPDWDLEPRRVSERDKNAPTLEEFYKTWTDS